VVSDLVAVCEICAMMFLSFSPVPTGYGYSNIRYGCLSNWEAGGEEKHPMKNLSPL